MDDTTNSLPRAVLEYGSLPLYQGIAQQIRDEIIQAKAKQGDRLPSERRLAERFGVSRDTLRSALQELQTLGMLETQRARGWFVAATSGIPGPHVMGFAEFAAASGLEAQTRVLSAGVRPATVEEAQTLRIAPGSELYELRRLRYLDGLIIVSEHNKVPLAHCPDLPLTDFSRASLYQTLREATPPQVAIVADYSVEARAPSEEERRMLEIDDEVPLLVANQLAYNQEGRPLELTVAAYRSDRYRFTASISNH